jgi:cob(I)alamin adenosyltransferase
MTLYTRTGDDGTTGLFGGGRVPKNHPRIEACGAIDELNAALGLAAANLPRSMSPNAANAEREPAKRQAGRHFDPKVLNQFHSVLSELQSRLFEVGADLATPTGSTHESKIKRIAEPHVSQIERLIDDIDSGNAPMRHFVLPGGTELAARLHLARTLCRRAERAIVHLHEVEPVNLQAMIFINRVSDLLFAMARRANTEAGVPDIEWIP